MKNAASEKKDAPTGQESNKKNVENQSIGGSNSDAMNNVGSENKDTQPSIGQDFTKKGLEGRSVTGGELDTLRNILFGAQAQATDDRLENLEALLVKSSDELSNNISALAQSISRQMNEMQAEFRKRDDDLRQQLFALIKSLDEQKTSREDLSSMLINMGNELRKSNKSNIVDSRNEENR